MEFLAGALVLMVIATGTATLSGHPVASIVAGFLAGAAVLLVTRGREIRRWRRPAPSTPPSGRSGAGSATRAIDAGAGAPAGPVVDVVPEDELTAVPLDGRTAAAVTFGTAGLFLFNIVFGPLAIGLGLAALRRGAPGRWGRAAAVAAMLLGVADLLVLAVLIVMRSAGDGFHWHS
jgi:hypothetical protein